MRIALFVLRRVAALVVTLLVASVAIYGVLEIAPGDPAALLAGGHVPDPATLAAIRREFHLDDPFVVRYVHWLGGFVTGDLGQSMVFRDSVAHLLGSRVVTTLMLVVYAGLLILVLGVGLGILGALGGKRVNTAVTVGTTVAMGAPTFVIAIVLIWLFATTLTWLPVYGTGTGFGDRMLHLTLPAIALSFTFIAYVTRITRAAVAEELRSDHVDTARSRGIPGHLVIRRHVLRNATPSILTVSGVTIAGLVAGTAVAEDAFGVNGIGSLLVQSAARQDLAVVQAISLFVVAAFVVINTIVDITNAVLDPRLARSGATA
ncbi:peptide/nickel transport system permease protein [Kibdelosporangium banguiense]|uniref:Peptide/nickel transport system permease protein n=1 Tax=Kibdelosporangium banguiense TaxID=1365924 RepID=A0ABS4TXR9_9PSEU|nr:ABC transporter permease [Kibdelosporangium banguiense]MBP2329202.1 peptide/nickel transport system permease protein [Kibdelosporangium banguiense]